MTSKVLGTSKGISLGAYYAVYHIQSSWQYRSLLGKEKSINIQNQSTMIIYEDLIIKRFMQDLWKPRIEHKWGPPVDLILETCSMYAVLNVNILKDNILHCWIKVIEGYKGTSSMLEWCLPLIKNVPRKPNLHLSLLTK